MPDNQHEKINYLEIPVTNISVSKTFFDFPGGRCFHFVDSSGNEFAVWSE